MEDVQENICSHALPFPGVLNIYITTQLLNASWRPGENEATLYVTLQMVTTNLEASHLELFRNETTQNKVNLSDRYSLSCQHIHRCSCRKWTHLISPVCREHDYGTYCKEQGGTGTEEQGGTGRGRDREREGQGEGGTGRGRDRKGQGGTGRGRDIDKDGQRDRGTWAGDRERNRGTKFGLTNSAQFA